MRIIKKMESLDACWQFAKGFYEDPELADFRFSDQQTTRGNLSRALERPETHEVLGIEQNGQLIGLFELLVLPEESYIEMVVGLSRVEEAYRAFISYLETNFPGYKADFVFNPRNKLLKRILEEKTAEFDTELQKMTLKNPVPAVDTTGIELLSEQYIDQYLAIHNRDMYWTGEKVIASPDRFRTFVALEGDTVVGYLDVTHCYEENEPYDVFISEGYRRKGYGRKLLAAALTANAPKEMMLLVDVDNYAAITLYTAMGFVKAENQNCLTAHWIIPK